MKMATRNIVRIGMVSLLVLTLAGCATQSRKSNNTLAGAGLGAAAGAVLSQGDPLFTVGGAAAGGLLGNVLTKKDSNYRSSNRHGNYSKRKNKNRDSRRRSGKRRR